MAQQAVALGALAPGRFRLGIGPSHEPSMVPMLGIKWEAPLGHLREYLQEESRDVPSRYETERFARSVAALRDDVDRLAARIERLGGGR